MVSVFWTENTMGTFYIHFFEKYVYNDNTAASTKPTTVPLS